LERLRRKTDLDRVFREGRRFYSPWTLLQARPRSADEDLPPGPRLAVVAGKRFRKAVTRNRARRLLREACRAAIEEPPGEWDLLLIARPEVLNVPFAELVQAISDLLCQARALGGKAAAAP